MNLTPNERLQVTNLLGALQGGLSGATGYSIFSGLTNDIQDRRARQQAQKLNEQRMLLAQQAAALQQQQQQFSNALSVERQQFSESLATGKENFTESQAHLAGLDDLMKQLFAEAAPKKVAYETTTPGSTGLAAGLGGAPGSTKKTITTTQPKTYQEVLGELSTLGAVVPGGISQKETQALAAGLDTAYSLPDLTSNEKARLDAGKGVLGLDDFWQKVQTATHQGMMKNVEPQKIMDKVLSAAAQSGYGSPDEQKAVLNQVSAMMDARGYTGPVALPGTRALFTDSSVTPATFDPARGLIGATGKVGTVSEPAVSLPTVLGTLGNIGLAVGAAKVGKHLIGRQLSNVRDWWHANDPMEMPSDFFPEPPGGFGTPPTPPGGAPGSAAAGAPGDASAVLSNLMSGQAQGGELGALWDAARAAPTPPPAPWYANPGTTFQDLMGSPQPGSLGAAMGPVPPGIEGPPGVVNPMTSAGLAEGQPLENAMGGLKPAGDMGALGTELYGGLGGADVQGTLGALGGAAGEALGGGLLFGAGLMAPQVDAAISAAYEAAHARWSAMTRDQQIEAYQHYTQGDPGYSWVERMFMTNVP